MPAPRAIIDSYESILGIYFSGVRHRERAAFILVDELVEIVCKLRAREHNHQFNMKCNFHQAWNAPGVQIPPVPHGNSIQARHNTRNLMQHSDPAATVDDQHCADSILEAMEVVELCWPGTVATELPDWMKVGLRIVRLYSSHGDLVKRIPFEDEMRRGQWRIDKRQPRTYELQIEPGRRQHWALLLTQSQVQVEAILSSLAIP